MYPVHVAHLATGFANTVLMHAAVLVEVSHVLCTLQIWLTMNVTGPMRKT